MRTRLLTAMLVILGTVTFTTVLAHAQTSSNGPYYATPSWDQKLQCDTAATCPRFIVLSNWNSLAVLDRETGLVWERSPLAPCLDPRFCIVIDTGTRSWFRAKDRCAAEVKAGDRGGWRLPTVEELRSLLDFGTPLGLGQLPPGHPFIGAQRDLYWSGTNFVDSVAGTPDRIYVVDVDSGATVPALKIDAAHVFVWCVRAGQVSNPQ